MLSPKLRRLTQLLSRLPGVGEKTAQRYLMFFLTAEPQLAHLISVLEPDAGYVLLPRTEYDALAGPWGLPAQ